MNAITVTLVFLIIQILPTLVYYFGFSASLALGSSVDGVLLIATAFLSFSNNKNTKLGQKLPTNAFLAIVVSLIILHMFGASMLNTMDLRRALFSIIPLLILILAALSLASIINELPYSSLNSSLRIGYIWMTIFVLLNFLGYFIHGDNATVKAIFPFVEPSHFAISFLPILMYSSTSGPGWYRICALAIGMLLAIYLQNLTLAVGCVLVASISLRFAGSFATLMVLGLAFTQIDITYYLSRLNFFEASNNLSTLTYVQGWQLIEESLLKSNGWGLGFQQLGVLKTEVWAAGLIYNMTGARLNLLDGGFLFSKIVCEFGIFGIAISLIYLHIAFNSFIQLRGSTLRNGGNSSKIDMAHCFVLSFLLELFVRGSGYFTPTVLMALASLIYLHRSRAMDYIK